MFQLSSLKKGILLFLSSMMLWGCLKNSSDTAAQLTSVLPAPLSKERLTLDLNKEHEPPIVQSSYKFMAYDDVNNYVDWNWTKTLTDFTRFGPGPNGHVGIATGGARTDALFAKGTYEFELSSNKFVYERLAMLPGILGPNGNEVCASGTAPNCRPNWGEDPVAYDYKASAYSFFPYDKSFKWRDVEKISMRIKHHTATDYNPNFDSDCGIALGFGEVGNTMLAPAAQLDMNMPGRFFGNDHLRFHYRLHGGKDIFMVQGPLGNEFGRNQVLYSVDNESADSSFNMANGQGPFSHGEFIQYQWDMTIDHANGQIKNKFTPLDATGGISTMTVAEQVWDYTASPDNMSSDGSEKRAGVKFGTGDKEFTLNQWLDSQVMVGFITVGVVLSCEFDNVQITYQGIPEGE